MTKKKTGKLTLGLLVAGAVLMLSAIAFTVINISLEKTAQRNATAIADRMIGLIPEVKNAQADDRVDTRMASVSVDGADFCAIIEIPAFGKKLPVYCEWDLARVRMYPCRYTGSTYDGTLVIGGSDTAGQLDFLSEISERDALLVTDTEGNCYIYEVARIDLVRSADTETLTEGDHDLVLFARNTYGDGYTVVRCSRD